MVRRLLGLLFLSVVSLRVYLYSKKIFKSYKSKIKIISIGNVSFGGAGKTPFTLWLAKRLVDQGLKIAILERGYKSGLPKKESRLWEKANDLALGEDLALIGDEAQMLWNVLPKGARLCVCSDKTRGAMDIENKWPDTDVILLDDGFQHLRLKRDTNIVLMEALGAFEDRLFPMGRLREPYSSLKRAEVLIFTKSDALPKGAEKSLRDSLSEKAKSLNPKIKIFFANSIFKLNLDLNGKKIFPVSSIYDPKYFHMNLKELGAVFERYMAFRDHYAYDEKTVKMIIDNAKSVDAKYVLLTSKDWVKLRPILSAGELFAGFDPVLKTLNGIQFVESYYEHDLEKEEEFLTCCI